MRKMLAAIGAAGLVAGLAAFTPSSAASADDPDLQPLQSTTVVMNEVQTHGSSANNQFIELRNISNVNQDISGFRLFRCTNNGSASQIVVIPANTILAPMGQVGQYYLVAPAAIDLVTPNLVATPNLAADGGTVLASGTNPIANHVDSVAFKGTTTGACLEGSAAQNVPVSNPNNLSAQRDANGTDTDDNFNDFDVDSRTPQNSASLA